MTSKRVETIQRLVQVRRARMVQAQSRLREADLRASDAARQVNDAESLLADYALDRLGPGVPIEAVERQRRFAGKVGELLQSRRVQVDRIRQERDRRFALLTVTRNQLHIAEKLALVRAADAQREEARKVRRRSIHRPSQSGTLMHQSAMDQDSSQDGHPAGNQYRRGGSHDIGNGPV